MKIVQAKSTKHLCLNKKYIFGVLGISEVISISLYANEMAVWQWFPGWPKDAGVGVGWGVDARELTM